LKPTTVIIDPISSLVTIGNDLEVRAMLIRMLDAMKQKQITSMFTSLTHLNSIESDHVVNAVSSLADSWIDVCNELLNDHRIRYLLIVKVRGMGHVRDRQEFAITDKGIVFKNLPVK